MSIQIEVESNTVEKDINIQEIDLGSIIEEACNKFNYEEADEEDENLNVISNYAFEEKYSKDLFKNPIEIEQTQYYFPTFTYRQRKCVLINEYINLDFTLNETQDVKNILLVCFIYGTSVNYYYSNGIKRISDYKFQPFKSKYNYRLIGGSLKFIFNSLTDFRVAHVNDNRILYDFDKHPSINDRNLLISVKNSVVEDHIKHLTNNFPIIYTTYASDSFRDSYGNCGFYVELPYSLFEINFKEKKWMLEINYTELNIFKTINLDVFALIKESTEYLNGTTAFYMGYLLNHKIGKYNLYFSNVRNLIEREDYRDPFLFFWRNMFEEPYNEPFIGITLWNDEIPDENAVLLFDIKKMVPVHIYMFPPVNEFPVEDGIITIPPEYPTSENFLNLFQNQISINILQKEVAKVNVSNNALLNYKFIIEEYSLAGSIYPVYYPREDLLSLITFFIVYLYNQKNIY